ncbi:MAG: hypothetical protein J3K34DRAFT_433940 [Monoraphidium minutum]|nr:MAG: hypothetical protein J3K34DRAFT_433940 [Monoraphidium minutum]
MWRGRWAWRLSWRRWRRSSGARCLSCSGASATTRAAACCDSAVAAALPRCGAQAPPPLPGRCDAAGAAGPLRCGLAACPPPSFPAAASWSRPALDATM